MLNWLRKSYVRSWRNPRRKYYISTVILSYAIGRYRYETMVFNDSGPTREWADLDGTRYLTEEAAVRGHKAYVRRARFGRVGYEYGTPEGF